MAQPRQFEIPFGELGITVEVARSASTNLPASPLFELVGNHVLALRSDADLVSSSATAADVGQRDSSARPSAYCFGRTRRAFDTLRVGRCIGARVFAYVRQHLTERDLTPLTIARARTTFQCGISTNCAMRPV